ncbi:MAG: hypothetical protein D6731_02445, partial [Planctomycetota bacterium]
GEGAQGPVLDDLAAVDRRSAGRAGRKGPTLEKLRGSLFKLMFLAVASVLLPGLGVFVAVFALVGSVWALRALERVPGGEAVRTRAIAAVAVSALAALLGVGLAVALWRQGGLPDG